MYTFFAKKLLPVAAAVVSLWLAGKYLLPPALPFLLGGAVALLAEPVVCRVGRSLGRIPGAALGVSLTLAVLGGSAAILGAVALQQVGRLAQGMPQLADAAQEGLRSVQQWLSGLSDNAPRQLQPLLQRTVQSLFSDGTVLIGQMTQYLPGAVGSAIGTVGNGLLGLGTGVVSAFLISARLPQLRDQLSCWEPWKQLQPGIARLRGALWGWLKAQLKLCAVTWGIVSVGFLLLGIRSGVLWAAAVALVDAVPILGTGTVLIPWAVVCLLRGESLRAIGLLCTYGTALMTRTVLEPKLVGRQLGLDPLTTLVTLYFGYRFWGFPGLLLTPIVASALYRTVVNKA